MFTRATARRLSTAAAIGVSVALVASGCSSAADDGKVTIEFMPVTSANLTAEFWGEIVDGFEAENPNINVEYNTGSAEDFNAFSKTLYAAGKLPDVLTVLNTDLAQLGALAPLDADSVEPFRNVDDIKLDGVNYYVPTALQPQSLLWYNKDLFTAAGLDPEAPPTTTKELDEAVHALEGVTPVPFAFTGEWTSGFQIASMALPRVMDQDSDWYAQRLAGDVTFADSGWEDNAKMLDGWNKEGLLGQGVLSKGADAGGQEFIAGGSGIYPMGVWYGATLAAADLPFEVGVFPMPTESGDAALSVEFSLNYAISADSEHPAEAKKLLTYVTQNADAVGKQLAKDGLFSNAIEPVTYELSGPLPQVADLLTKVTFVASRTGSGDAVPPPGFADFLTTSAQSLILGDLTPESYAEGFDQWWDSNQE